ncbi:MULTISPECIES: GDSL-type esterase/lipase family protein [Streptomyces]|uniref:GDSL-type esterase/lipase family protein n=1 Tax=Streptomyces TaxID=1883 RepID=UPI001FD0BB7E|nr:MULTISPECIES: GDSL-type esterase/lipase family protein [Streptomyces]MCZ4097735.1 GDSL-type esterase/lipase family protein [Streptomyces sp. H39-C1]
MPERRHRTSRTTRLLAAALALPLVAAGLLAVAAPAQAATGPVVRVSMGDSYISGEAGRWKGNSDTASGSRDGTDRAWTGGSTYDPTTVYGSTYASGCDRSDSAEINSLAGAVNIACSGATTANVFRAGNGGQSFKGEAPQADQLASIAANNTVKLITLSIGGNDLGFSDVISTCVKDYLIWYSYCHTSQQSAIDSRMSAAMAGVGKSIDEIRAVMTADGYASGDYRIVLQSYPSPIPRSTEMRYPESGWSRASTGGCPFWNGDADWARDSMVPQISNALAGVAATKGVQFMDLRDMLQGREVCAKTSSLATPGAAPSATTSEWARFVDAGLSSSQGTVQESMHPNYYGELALGSCLTQLNAHPTGNYYYCRNTAGRDSTGMYLNAK